MQPPTSSALFGPERQWRRDDLIAASPGLDAQTVLEAYRSGVFPMPVGPGVTGWWSPLQRGILPLNGLRITRSLQKMTRRYRVTVDTAFDQVLSRCADHRRPGSWIDDSIREVYTRLHHAGTVHSLEAWRDDGRLAGGLYGVSLGGLFAGESMFHDPEIGRDASKVALVHLVELLRGGAGEDRLLDVQWRTDHLATLGVVEVPRRVYVRLLARALTLPEPAWPCPGSRRGS